MLNQVVLEGKLVSIPTLSEMDDGRTVTTIEVEVKKNYKNIETDKYESYIIIWSLWEGILITLKDDWKVTQVDKIKFRVNNKRHLWLWWTRNQFVQIFYFWNL